MMSAHTAGSFFARNVLHLLARMISFVQVVVLSLILNARFAARQLEHLTNSAALVGLKFSLGRHRLFL